MKLKVTHSARPCAASTRRASAARPCAGGQGRQRHRRGARQRDRRGSRPGRAAAALPRSGRIPARSARSPRRRLRRRRDRGRGPGRAPGRRGGDVVAPGRHRHRHPGGVARAHGEAQALQRAPPLRRPARRRRRTRPAGRSAGSRRAARRVRRRPAVTVPASPPHSSRIIRVAASIASGSRAGSIPRSNRWRASETIWWRRPDSAIRTGSNSAHSTNTVVVVSSQPVASPPTTPASDCTPAASAMAQSSGGRRVVLAVQRPEALARAAPQHQRVAGELGHVEHMQRPAEIDGEEIGHIDQRVDRPQPDRGQPVGQPARARPVAQAADRAPEDPGAGLRPVDPPVRPAVERGRHRRRRPGLQRADPGRRQVARHAAHRKHSRRDWASPRCRSPDHRARPRRHRACPPARRPAVRRCRNGRRRAPSRAPTAACPRWSRRGSRRSCSVMPVPGMKLPGGANTALHAGARVRRAAHDRHRRRRRCPHGRRAAGRRSGAAPLPAHGRCGTGRAPRRDRSMPSSSRPIRVSVSVIAATGASVSRWVAQPGQGELHRLRPPRAASPAPAG